MANRKKRLNRKYLLAKLHSIEGLLILPDLADTQARKFALIQVREMIQLLNETATKAKRPESGVKEHVASRNGGE